MEPVSVIILGVYFLILIGIGLWFSRKQESLNDFFLARRTIPAWAALASVVATETSAVTLIGSPAQSFAKGGDLSFLQVAFGYIIARIILSLFFLPKFFDREIVTIYAFLGIRFGRRAQRVSGIFFFITRALASGIRHYAAALVISSVFGVDLTIAILFTGLISVAYATMGGLSAVIWTEVFLLIVMITGGLLGFYYALHMIPGGWAAAMAKANEAGKLAFIHLDWSGGGNYSLLIGVLSGVCLCMASHGADQDMVQRLLSCRSLRSAQKALVGSGIFIFCQFAFFLFLGIVLYAIFGTLPAELTKNDEIYPYFAAKYMPPWAAGLVIASILSAALSSTASALNALASSSVSDFLLPLWKKPISERKVVAISRLFTVIWTLILIVIAILASHSKSIFDAGFSIASYTSGSLLAAFLLGIFTPLKNEAALIVGMFVGVVGVLTIAWFNFHWTWYVPAGTLTTLLVAYLLARVLPAPARGEA